MLIWKTDGDDKRTMVGRGNGWIYLVSRNRRNGKTGYRGNGTNGDWRTAVVIENNGEPFKLRRDAMAACERHAAEGETQPCPNR